jgi:hypothetical protein
VGVTPAAGAALASGATNLRVSARVLMTSNVSTTVLPPYVALLAAVIWFCWPAVELSVIEP